jgi:hypothetical protein
LLTLEAIQTDTSSIRISGKANLLNAKNSAPAHRKPT